MFFEIVQFFLQFDDARFALCDALIPTAYGDVPLLDGDFDLSLGADNRLFLFLERHFNVRHFPCALRCHALCEPSSEVILQFERLLQCLDVHVVHSLNFDVEIVEL